MLHSQSMYQNILHLVTIVPVFFIALSFHEFAHGIVATMFGDPTPRDEGRLTLNPFAHINWMGLLFLVIFRFGWANPVPFNSSYFKHKRFYTLLTAMAGPVTNFLLALIGMFCAAYSAKLGLSGLTLHWVLYFLTIFIDINIILGVFNLIPIPPLDGSHLLRVFAPDPDAAWIGMIEQYSIFFFLMIVMIPSLQRGLLWLVIKTKLLLSLLVF
ncbi:site-2 protease family protein [Candidatus Babeliales bacterium]|nr:site-2 protease family protein [Candidatus Babeliales bacterium]